MASWREVEESEPEFARTVQELLDAGKHKTIATLRLDGSPRISGTEATFVDGDLWFGSMWRARKALDLQRDPRLALHSASLTEPEWKGDAKVSGRAVEVDDDAQRQALVRAQGNEGSGSPGRFHLFRVEIAEVVLIRVGGDPPDHMLIDLWRPGQPLQQTRR